MHYSYENTRHRLADFRVRYRFYTAEEGGRQTIPYQGYRSDFSYEHPAHSGTNQLFMIWPEFENEQGGLILEDDVPVPAEGTARMWIINETGRPYHADKIKTGMTGHFREGARKVAECTVIELLSLNDDNGEIPH